ncbi:MAG: (Fe-S)-binding protein [Eggerthellaceae bacterium]|nr:(Fe-S)-binding protein [Eggerthellaceae bacterium]
MSKDTKHLRPRDLGRDVAVLSPTDDLKPLPSTFDASLEPEFKEFKDEWAETYCASLDGFVAIDTLKRPETKEEEEEFVRKFLSGLEKLFQDSNKNAVQPLALNMEFCAKCNTCSEACHIYEESNGDEIYRPSFRVDVLRRIYKKHFTTAGKMLGGFVGADIELNWETIARLAELSYRCNLCRRCAQACPMGLDNGLAAREIRKIFSQEMGIAPKAIHEKGTELQLKVGSTTGMTTPAFVDTAEFIEEDIEERTGRSFKFPMDKEGADVLLIHNAGEFIAWPDNPAAFAILLDEAGVDWTLSSEMCAYDGVNYGAWYDDIQAKKIAAKQFEVAKKLGVKRIVMGECGHAHKAIAVSADRMFAAEDKVPVESFLPLMLTLVREGRLKFDPSKNNFPVTLHDPCNYVRQMGIVQPQREIIRACTTDFREMTPHGVDNYCCGGGSGFAIMNNQNFSDFRNHVSARKKLEQIINAFGEDFENPDVLKYVCAPCSNCKGTIRELLKDYKITAKYNVQYSGLVELMVNALVSMEKPFFEFLEE